MNIEKICNKMQIEELCEYLQQEKKGRDEINSNYLSKNDYDVCDYVMDNIPNINKISYPGKIVLKKYAIEKSLKSFEIFNEENYQTLLAIIKKIKFIKSFPLHNSAVAVSFDSTINKEEKKILTPGYINAYYLPVKIYDIDIISLTHENCHALKETNYEEHKDYLITGEIIPIFYELINYERNFLKRKHLEYRLYWLQEQKLSYLSLKEYINNNNLSTFNNDTPNIYEYAKNYYARYLGSFYYALILYNMYKINPEKILNLVNDVLSHKITTLDMLNKLNIYCYIEGKTFEKEITHIKKVLSK